MQVIEITFSEVPRASDRSASRFNVWIEPKEILRVVLLFQGRQPLVVSTEGATNPVLVIVAQIIDVDAAGERLQRPPEVPCPTNVPFCVRCIKPLGNDDWCIS